MDLFFNPKACYWSISVGRGRQNRPFSVGRDRQPWVDQGGRSRGQRADRRQRPYYN